MVLFIKTNQLGTLELFCKSSLGPIDVDLAFLKVIVQKLVGNGQILPI